MADGDAARVDVSSFDETQSMADAYLAGRNVVLQLRSATPDLKRRVLDFASGMVYAAKGQLERDDNGDFLLSHSS